MDVSDAVSHKMNGLSEQFKTDVNGLYDNAARLAGEVSALSERLLQIGDSVQKRPATRLLILNTSIRRWRFVPKTLTVQPTMRPPT